MSQFPYFWTNLKFAQASIHNSIWPGVSILFVLAISMLLAHLFIVIIDESAAGLIKNWVCHLDTRRQTLESIVKEMTHYTAMVNHIDEFPLWNKKWLNHYKRR